ncbi:Uncharacterised protein [Mycobacteroides abscessus subsp. abscessus]|nr:Uncharacterised protein [Mycobacteroides abscessus subsp. abscessus]
MGEGRGQRRIGPGGRLGELFIGVLPGVGDEGGFVELDPLDAGGGEDAEDVEVDRGELVEALERRGRRPGRRLRQGEEGERADEDGPDAMPGGPRLGDEGEQVLGVGLERRRVLELGHEVVVVRVEPLRHLQRGAVGRATGQGEVLAEVEVRARRRRGDEPDGERGVEDVVVVAVGRGDRVVLGEAEFAQPVVGLHPQGAGRLCELAGVDAPGPEGFECGLEFAAASDARVAGDRGGRERGGHVSPSVVVTWLCGGQDGCGADAGTGAGAESRRMPRRSSISRRSSVVAWSLNV